jgi:predicted O-methyltransferase YrrM
MKFSDVKQQVYKIPFTTPAKGAVLYNTIIERSCEKCLELGFAHGVGTAYIAAALDQLGRGSVLAFDRAISKNRNPRADELLASIGLDRWANLVFGDHHIIGT